MTTARRRWLYVAVGVLAVVALVLAWTTLQAERRTTTARPVATSTPVAGQGVIGGGLATPSNALGAPVPEPESESQGSTDGSPIAPWWQRVPPVVGTLIPINRSAAGKIRIEDIPDIGLVITFDDLKVATIGTPPRTLRVVLSSKPVIGAKRGFWADDGSPVVVGDVPADTPTQSLVLANPHVLPAEVRSLVLFDADTGELLGGASLIPTD
jgi:hypothetical protein